MYLSSVYISKVFKEKTGESPINYLINLRLEKVKDLLISTESPVKSIAESVDYIRMHIILVNCLKSIMDILLVSLGPLISKSTKFINNSKISLI